MKNFRSNISLRIELILTSVLFILLFVLTVSLTTYYTFSNHTTDAIKIQTEEVNRQIIYNYENSVNQIINISNLIASDFEQLDLENDLEASRFLRSIIRTNSNILQISLYSLDNEVILNTGDIVPVDNIWFDEAKNDQTIHYFSPPQTYDDKTFLTVSKKLNNEYIDSYILKIDYNFDSFSSLAEKTSLGEQGHVTIFDYQYNLIYMSNDGLFETEEKLFKELIIGSKNITYEEIPMVLNIDTLLHTRWRIAVFTNVSDIVKIQQSFQVTVILTAIIFAIISMFIYYFLSNHLTNPLKVLEENMATTVKDYYIKREPLKLTGNLEITNLTKSYNQMVLDIESMTKEISNRYQLQIKSELKALQNQINPHFLYNTLDSIIWLIENNKNKEASEMITELATLFRISISQGENLITVENEIKHALAYLKIQTIRYPDAFEYKFNYSDDIKDIKTMKLILQPFIENSIYHGLKHNIDYGLIDITVKTIDNKLEYTIVDNGYGMKKELVDELNASLESDEISFGIGIKNVYERLKVYYGKEANVIIDSELDLGTKITITIPLGGEIND